MTGEQDGSALVLQLSWCLVGPKWRYIQEGFVETLAVCLSVFCSVTVAMLRHFLSANGKRSKTLNMKYINKKWEIKQAR